MSQHSPDYLACAIQVGDELLARAVRDERGALWWGRGFALDMSSVPDAGMFNGRCGEGWYLNALACASGLERFAEAGRDALSTLGRQLQQPRDTRNLAKRIGVGLTGVGSILYAFGQSARYLGDTTFVDIALEAVGALADFDYGDVGFAELYWGVPALALALLTLPERPTTRRALENAVSWLLCHRIEDRATGLRLWRPRFGPVQAGLAHGTTGVAHVLLCAHALLRSDEAYEAAQAALQFERQLYRPSTNAWPDTFAQPDEQVSTAWCHGGIGIGLSRMTTRSCLHGDAARAADEDIDHITLALRARRVRGPTNLCCGALGQIDFLLRASHVVDPVLSVGAHQLGASISEHMRMHGYRSLANDEAVPDGPGLWQGLAGIGYTMLRLHDPRQFPSLLTLEPIGDPASTAPEDSSAR